MVFEIVDSFQGLKRRVMMLVASGVLLTAAFVQMSDAQLRFPPQYISQTTAIYDQVFSIAKAKSQELMLAGKSADVSLYEPFPFMAPHIFRYRALVEGVALTLTDGGDSILLTDLDALREIANRADLVLVPTEAVMAEVERFHFPIDRFLAQFHAWLAENPGFSVVARFPFGRGQVLLYRAVPK
jgi:hypothetical protein